MARKLFRSPQRTQDCPWLFLGLTEPWEVPDFPAGDVDFTETLESIPVAPFCGEAVHPSVCTRSCGLRYANPRCKGPTRMCSGWTLVVESDLHPARVPGMLWP